MKQRFRVALAGNPNCGKTCIFNALTGARQHVGNYPGVTVESKSGSFTLNGLEIELIDLPGVYSLSSSSPEERVVFDELTAPGIDLIINVVDSTIPRRSLYLTTQLAELHIPMLLAFNMSDDARRKGMKYDIPKLETYFGSPVVQTVGSQASGVKPLLDRLEKTLGELEDHGVPMLSYGADIDDAINAVAEKIDALHVERYKHVPSRFFAIKLLEHDRAAMEIPEFRSVFDEVEVQIKHLWDVHAINADTFMADRRYAMLAGACRDAISMTQERRREISDKIDLVMTNRFLGLPIFLAIMFVTFWVTFVCAEPIMAGIEGSFDWLAETIGNAWSEATAPFLRSLLIEGVIKGVGGVIVFLPNILFLFFFIAILEDSGYMARAAFIMDGIMRTFGLQGRSFVPLVLGFGCTVPAIMATRTIESERDRTVTIMVLPFMSCSARLPIYALIIPAFFPKYEALTMFLIYLIGIVVALGAARLMKSTLFKGEGEVYLMELPPYRMPTAKSLLLHMWDRSKMYLHKAGTIILGASIVLWICNTFPEKKSGFARDYDAEIVRAEKKQTLTPAAAAEAAKLPGLDKEQSAEILRERKVNSAALDAIGQKKADLSEGQKKFFADLQTRADEVTELKNAKQAEMMEYTVSGRVGHFMEPVMRPAGFDWRIATAIIGALAAKEVFVSQMGILYSQGEADENSESLRSVLSRHYTPLQAFCIMLFCLLSVPCMATLTIIRRELNSWKMAAIEAGALLLFAWCVATVVFQLGSLLNIGTKFLS